MNSIEGLREYVRSTYPRADLTVTEPLHEGGVWSLDIDLADKQLAIQCYASGEFGISSASRETFAEGPDEVLPNLEQAKLRVDQLLSTTERTSPSIGLTLSRVREHRGLTQSQLAKNLGLRQATISGLERRGDVQLSTLRRVVAALGGVIELYAVFPDARYSLEAPVLEPFLSYVSEINIANQDLEAAKCDDTVFSLLSELGRLPDAYQIADTIRNRHSVLEMP